MHPRTLPFVCALPLLACAPAAQQDAASSPVLAKKPMTIRAGKPVEDLPGETFFRNVRQLTFGGENAEAYWSGDGSKLILQSTRPPHECDQIFVLDLDTGEQKLVSTGRGRTTCAYFLQGDRRILYSSTHLASDDCPPPVMRVDGRYVWPIYASYDVFSARADGTDLQRLTDSPGYDAESTVCPVTGRIVFTSTRDGDLEIYSMEPDGTDVRRLTKRLGYDGGPFYSPDGTKIVLRSSFHESEESQKEYLAFLEKNVVVPTALEITVMDRNGENFRRITSNGAANFAPFFCPDNRRIIFASNQSDPKGRDFELYVIDEDGKNQQRVTNNPTFDGFPMFSPDGKYLAFASNRYAAERGATNVFVAEWVE